MRERTGRLDGGGRRWKGGTYNNMAHHLHDLARTTPAHLLKLGGEEIHTYTPSLCA